MEFAGRRSRVADLRVDPHPRPNHQPDLRRHPTLCDKIAALSDRQTVDRRRRSGQHPFHHPPHRQSRRLRYGQHCPALHQEFIALLS